MFKKFILVSIDNNNNENTVFSSSNYHEVYELAVTLSQLATLNHFEVRDKHNRVINRFRRKEDWNTLTNI